MAGHPVAGGALAAAATAPLVRLDSPAGQHRPVRLEALPEDSQAEFVEAAERGQVRGSKGRSGGVPVMSSAAERSSVPALG